MPVDEMLLSLHGLSVGDAFGYAFGEFRSRVSPALIVHRELPPGPWRWTDDTHMALSIVEVLREQGQIDQARLAQGFARRFMQESHRGYGQGARKLLTGIALGSDWRASSQALFNSGSFGNGGAMRAAPIGGYFAGDLARAAEQANLSAEVTHFHPEGKAGAAAVAVAASLAATQDHPPGADFLRRVLELLPECETRQGIEIATRIAPERLDQAVQLLGTGERVSAQDTVPFCLWVSAYHLDDYESALWTTVAGLGDRDTTCAIVGGIVALSAKQVPEEWVRRREPLPEGFER